MLMRAAREHKIRLAAGKADHDWSSYNLAGEGRQLRALGTSEPEFLGRQLCAPAEDRPHGV